MKTSKITLQHEFWIRVCIVTLLLSAKRGFSTLSTEKLLFVWEKLNNIIAALTKTKLEGFSFIFLSQVKGIFDQSDISASLYPEGRNSFVLLCYLLYCKLKFESFIFKLYQPYQIQSFRKSPC